MILVTGTKRSGTSMWMQVLRAGGFPVIGEAFPRDWARTLRDANPDGFWESELRGGIWHATNPHPQTGAYLFPEQVRRHAVKVFVPGLVRSDRAFIDRVIGTMRPWRAWVASSARLTALESAAMQRDGGGPPLSIPPVLEWWSENFMLVRDIATRRYPVYLVSYDAVVAEPERVVGEVFSFLGDGDAAAGAAAVRRDADARSDAPTPSDVSPADVAVFDELFARVHEGRAIDGAFVAALNETNDRLAPRVAEAWQAVEREQAARRAGATDR